MKPPLCNLLLYVLIGLLCHVGLGDAAGGTTFTSVEAIKNAMRLDRDIAFYLREHLNEIPDPKLAVLEYIDEQERMEQEIELMSPEERQKSSEISEEALLSQMAKNPLHSYQTIRRVTLDAFAVMTLLNKMKPELVAELKQLLKQQTITYRHDATGAARGLVRLQDIYKLRATELIQGKIKHLQTTARLTVGDCLLIGQAAKDQTRLDLYVEWMEQAHYLCEAKVAETGTAEKDPCSHTTLPLMIIAGKEHDENVKNHAVQILPYPISTKSATEQLNEQYEAFDPYQNPFLEMSLCYKSGSLMTPAEEAQLTCHYWRRPSNPYVTLQRFKVEMLSKLPPIMTIYDVISNEEADLIREMATPSLTRSTVVGREDHSVREYSDQRISSTAWLSDRSHPRINAISQRIALITGFNVTDKNAEEFQVVNYGIGGMYNAHYDYLYKQHDLNDRLDDPTFMGNRIVTFILYLNDVELGGATAFPNRKTAVTPKKGAAALWFNINEFGVPDVQSFHGGCPVLYGSKWIANKWILERGQMFSFPCPAKPNKYHFE